MTKAPRSKGQALWRGPGAAPLDLRRRALIAASLAILPTPTRLSSTSSHPGLNDIARQGGRSFGAELLSAELDDAAYRTLFTSQCGVLTPGWEAKWDHTEPEPGRFEFARLDRLLDFAARTRIAVRMHTLLWGLAMPPWLVAQLRFGTPAEARAVLARHVGAVVGHARGRVLCWDVANEVSDPVWHRGPEGLTLSPWRRALGPDCVPIAFALAREADPRARLFVNEDGLEWQGARFDDKRATYLRLLEGWRRAGVPIDGFGLQTHLSASFAFDERAYRAFLRDLAGLGLEIHLTELDVRDRSMPADASVRDRLGAALVPPGSGRGAGRAGRQHGRHLGADRPLHLPGDRPAIRAPRPAAAARAPLRRGPGRDPDARGDRRRVRRRPRPTRRGGRRHRHPLMRRPVKRGARATTVWVVAPGGRDDTGGICRMVDHQAACFEAGAIRVVDSGGMAPRTQMPLRAAAALLLVAGAALGGRIGLLHVHVAAWGSVARKAPFVLLGRALRIPVVLHLHAADFGEFHASLSRIGRRLVRFVFAASDTVVVLGARSRALMHDGLGLDQSRLQILPNAVPDIDVTPGARTARAAGRCRLVFLGALTERKGLADLFVALAAPGLAALPWHLAVIGNGDAAAWRALAAACGIEGRISFHGWMTSAEARAFLSADADLLVLPSRAEGLPMVILEAMAAGLPVVATDVGDVGEAVVDGLTGALVPPRDPASLSRALSALVASETRRARAGRAGRARYEARFTLGDHQRRLQALFASALREAARPPPRAAEASAR